MILLRPSLKCDECGAVFDPYPATATRRAQRNAILQRDHARELGWDCSAKDDRDTCPVCNGNEGGPF